MVWTYVLLLVAFVMSTSAALLDERGSMTGIDIDPDITTIYNDMKLKGVYKWCTFKIENKKKIVLDAHREGDPTLQNAADKNAWNELVSSLGHTPRYILYDMNFTLADGREIKKIIFMFWCSDTDAKIGDKMIYASSKDTIKKVFTGLSIEFQANNIGDMDYDQIRKEVERKAK